MDYFTVKKLSEKYKIDFYQLISYLEYLDIPIEVENKIKVVSEEYIPTIDKFLSAYTINQIAYMKSHNVKPFFEGTLLLDLRKRYNLNEKQFKTKCANIDLEFKYVYSDDECQQFDDYINGNTKNKADLRDEKYIKEGWIPLRKVIEELGEKYQFSKNTALDMLKRLNIEVYKPLHQLSFINEEQKKQFEDFLKKFNTSTERQLFLQEQTCMERYGVKNGSQSEEARAKLKEKNSLNAQERLEKAKQTNLKRYGVDNFFRLFDTSKYWENLSEKIREERNKKISDSRKHYRYINSDKIYLQDLLELFNKDDTGISRVLSKLGIYQNEDNHVFIYKVDLPRLVDYYKTTENSMISYLEKEIVTFIKSIYYGEIIENSRNIIPPKELDIYVPEKKLAIEFDGLYWHNEIYTDKKYHLRKTLACNEKGIDLIHVFEDDWLYKKEIVKSMIASRLDIYQKRVFARKCNIEKIKKEQAKDFFNKNHLQGFTYGDLYLGLTINNELVQCICINKKGWHDGNVELTRMVTKLNTQVIGGFSKLMSHIDDYIEYNSISSYIYRAWFNGNGYLNVGFKIVKENPCSYYYVVENKKVHKSHFRRARIKKFYRQGYLKYYDENKTEHENMLDNHIYRIYDCGTIKVIYSKNKK